MKRVDAAFSREDRDLLIRLDSKVDQLSLDIKEVKDGVNTRVTALEAKTVGYDKLINEIDPLKLAAMVQGHDKFIHDFNLTKKLILAIVGAIGGVIGAIATLIFETLRLIKP